jgi:hypothetical protein
MGPRPVDILLDLQKELQGELLEADVVVRGKTFKFRLMNERESSWTFGHINPTNSISIALSSRLSSLAVGVRAIDGVLISDLFEPKFLALDVLDRNAMLERNGNSLRFCYCELFMEYLSELPGSFITELFEDWQKLEIRRLENLGELKNSSGESLVKEEKKSLTELSQAGDPLPQE